MADEEIKQLTGHIKGPQPHLKRALSLPMMVLYGLGTTVGAGIYVLLGEVAATAGMMAPLSFIVASLLAGFTAFSFGELCSRFPKSAGEAVYTYEGTGSVRLAFIVGILVVAVGMTSSATISIGFSGYFNNFINEALNVGPFTPWLVVLCVVLLLGLIAAWGISESVTAAVIFTFIELAGLLLVIWSAREGLYTAPAHFSEMFVPTSGLAFAGVLAGGVLAFYAFIGFEDMVNVAEETVNPERTMPIAIILVLAFTVLLYLLLAMAAVLSLPLDELARSNAPLALLFSKTALTSPAVISFIGMVAVINGALIQTIMASRVLYGMSNQGWLPKPLRYVHPITRTPLIATGVVVVMIATLAMLFTLVKLAEVTSVLTLSIFAIVNFALIRVKQKNPKPRDVRTFPVVIPYIGAIISTLFVLYQIALWVGLEI